MASHAPTDVSALLAGREGRYGSFQGHALIAQRLKHIINTAVIDSDHVFEADQLEDLDMIAHKLARIANGDPSYADNWIDIAGYATLVAHRLEAAPTPPAPPRA